MSLWNTLVAARIALDGAVGLREVYFPPPEAISGFPVGILMPVDGDATMGQSEMWDHRFALHVFVERDNLPARIAVLLPTLEAVMARVRTNITLGGTVNLFAITGYRFTVPEYAGGLYVGLTIDFGVREKYNVTLSG